MQITFTPMRRDDQLRLERHGEVLYVNDEPFDFSALPDGAMLPRAAVTCHWLASDIYRTGGVLWLTLILPHGPDAPPETRFPDPILRTEDGIIPVPPPGPWLPEETRA